MTRRKLYTRRKLFGLIPIPLLFGQLFRREPYDTRWHTDLSFTNRTYGSQETCTAHFQWLQRNLNPSVGDEPTIVRLYEGERLRGQYRAIPRTGAAPDAKGGDV